jgi:hypothetical protein
LKKHRLRSIKKNASHRLTTPPLAIDQKNTGDHRLNMPISHQLKERPLNIDLKMLISHRFKNAH